MTISTRKPEHRMIFISHEDQQITADVMSYNAGLTSSNKWNQEQAENYAITFTSPKSQLGWALLHRKLRMLFSPFTYETAYEMFEPNPFFTQKNTHQEQVS
ncbi:hypothetical protein [Pseudoalteromonas denitrificans]|uniref:Uncharacterized protein n=1 Tax=Pseudoalteromonas denitrificans DSM 6059 TaxID=1123010 RepID=A0A1I1T7K9_9GAMM|nr:hypothetical protein [Pseudoalteromonas denitrificans]SFD54586.1 hypothetical protein SAMN02745724_04806 [Pseudoalteromonas denitrificans DSM 6059]